MSKTLNFFVTLGPIGYFKGSGTYASFFSLIFAYLININFGSFFTIAIAILTTIIGYLLTKIYLKNTENKDPPEVVIDEVAGQFLASSFAGATIEVNFLSFIIFRILDIFKPYPISNAENLEGSLGVMADDVVAGIITMFIIIALNYFLI